MSLSDTERALKRALSGEVRRLEPMARHTTFRIGGPADLFVRCDTLADIVECLRILEGNGVQWFVVGRGSNLLVADAGYRGAVIALGREFKKRSVADATITAGGACVLGYLVQDAFAEGLGGLEFAVGIPGTLGGAIAMNAGTRDRWMDSVVESVTAYVPERGLVRLRRDEIEWGYRTVGLPSGAIVVEAVVRLELADRARIRTQMEASLKRRRASQPLGLPSAGSVFKNPPGDSAGRLIEAAGLKGVRLGGARISEVHANFIVNEGRATAADVLRLVRKVQMTVRDTYGIELQPEITLLGAFDEA